MVQHPYVPESLKLPGYVPNFLSNTQILTTYALVCLGVCFAVWLVTGRFHHVQRVEKLLMCWLAFTGLTHLILEAYFVFTPNFYAVNYPSYLAEVWKEYSKADSRYASRDSTVVAVEVVLSLFDGPASLLAMYAIVARKSYKHPLLLVICMVDVLMFVIYFATPWLDGNVYACEPFYFWVYYTTLNSLYGVFVPALIGLRSWNKIIQALQNEKNKIE